MKHTTIGVDLAKSVFEVGPSESPGSVKVHRRLSRQRFAEFVASQPPATFVMEACGSAHLLEPEVPGSRARGCPVAPDAGPAVCAWEQDRPNRRERYP